MKQIDIFEDTKVTTFQQVVQMFRWCMGQFGEPGDRWTYSKRIDFTGSDFVNSPEEIEFITFYNDDDYIIFKLAFDLA